MRKIKPTAAVYDRWLSTLGGGEQVAFAYAEALRDFGYQTELLTHQRLNIHKAKQKMGINLDQIKVRYLPDKSTQELSQYTEQYDLFVNTSYLDYFPNRSKKGILSVFFPDQIYLSPTEYFKRRLVIPSLRKLFIYPTRFEGFLYDEYRDKRIFKWVGENSQIFFSGQITKFTVLFYATMIGFSLIDETEFYYNDVKIEPQSKKLRHKSNVIEFSFEVNPSLERGQNKFSIVFKPNKSQARVALLSLTIPGWKYFLYNIFKLFFPLWEMRLHGGPGITKRSDLESYDQIITISNFCIKWIDRYWKLPSIVLYPPVQTKLFLPSSSKKNWIVHVGRFFVTGHNKKQQDLVKVFKKMITEHQLHDWELHCVGSIHPGEQHQQYFNQVQFLAQGFPIHFHIDVSFVELKSILAKAKIYWHATGLDENENKNPILFEHFGVTTVEAMASGAVPVVINAGGQTEIVTPESGFLWNSRQQLIDQTVKLIKKPELLAKYSKKAVIRSRYFDKQKFVTRLQQILEETK